MLNIHATLTLTRAAPIGARRTSLVVGRPLVRAERIVNSKMRRALKRMNARRRAGWRFDVRLDRSLASIGARLARIESRGTPDQWRQAFDDLLRTYGLAAQMAEVVGQQRDQIQAFGEAMVRFHELFSDAMRGLSDQFTQHDANEMQIWEEARDLMVQLRELIRVQVRKTENLERQVGLGQAERARHRDRRPEEKE
jgi:hypothetical protein